MRRVTIVIEDLCGRHSVSRVIDMTLLDLHSKPGDLLESEYRLAKLRLDVQIDNARTAGPKGKLP